MAWQQPSMHSQQMKQAHMSTIHSPVSLAPTNKQTPTRNAIPANLVARLQRAEAA